MITLIFVTISAFFALKWFQNKFDNMILLWYLLEKKNLPVPSPAEVEEGRRWVMSHLLRDLGIERSGQ